MAVRSGAVPQRAPRWQPVERWAETGLTVSEAAVVALMLVAAAAIRFIALSHQSFWLDETFTVADVRPPGLGSVLSSVAHLESSPPLYPILGWVWAKLFGTGEAALRSLSALAGVATVAVGWAATRRLVGRRAALIAVALLAVNPMLVWYSQEARSYALLTLFGALSLLFLARLREQPTRANAAGWALASILGLLAHYFAAFVFAAELAWLLFELRGARRLILLASVPVILVGLALAPLAIHQSSDGRNGWIAAQPLGGRVVETLHELGSANVAVISSGSAPTRGPLGWIAVGLLVGALALGALAATRRERRAARAPAAVGLLTILIPLGLTLVGLDYFKDRNLIGAWVPLIALLAAALAVRRTWPAGLAAAVAICGLGLAADVEVTRDSYLQRQDWRAVSRALGQPRRTRALAFFPGYYAGPLELYGQSLYPAQPGARVRELILVGLLPAHPALPRGLRLVQSDSFNTGLRLERFDAARLVTVPQTSLRAAGAQVMTQAGPRLASWLRAASAQAARWERLARFLRRQPAGAVPTALLRPAASAAVLLNPPPEFPHATAVQAAIRAVLRASAPLAAPGAPRSAAAGRFQRALVAFRVAASGHPARGAG